MYGVFHGAKHIQPLYSPQSFLPLLKKLVALLTKEKGAMNEWENDDSDILQALHSVY